MARPDDPRRPVANRLSILDEPETPRRPPRPAYRTRWSYLRPVLAAAPVLAIVVPMSLLTSLLNLPGLEGKRIVDYDELGLRTDGQRPLAWALAFLIWVLGFYLVILLMELL